MVLPKIHKHLFNVPGRPVIANCETRTNTLIFVLNLLYKMAGPMLKTRMTLRTK